MSIYPLFIPPKELYEIPKESWRLAHAKQYFSWLMIEKSCRVDRLLNYLKLDVNNFTTPRRLLENALIQAVDLFKLSEFSDQNELTNHGYALAADLGLLLVACLEKEFNFIQWEIRKKPKSDINYLMPCYCLPDGYSRDPILVSTSYAYAVIRGEKGAEGWLRWYDAVRAEALNIQQIKSQNKSNHPPPP